MNTSMAVRRRYDWCCARMSNCLLSSSCTLTAIAAFTSSQHLDLRHRHQTVALVAALTLHLIDALEERTGYCLGSTSIESYWGVENHIELRSDMILNKAEVYCSDYPSGKTVFEILREESGVVQLRIVVVSEPAQVVVHEAGGDYVV